MANIRVTPAEIGGGFGGKTLIYLEPVALVLSRKTGRAVKIVMTREEVFRATGPTSGGVIQVKLGAKRDGTIVAADLVLKYQAGAFSGSPVQPGCMCAFAMYDLPNVNIVGYDVASNRPKEPADFRKFCIARRQEGPRLRTGRPGPAEHLLGGDRVERNRGRRPGGKDPAYFVWDIDPTISGVDEGPRLCKRRRECQPGNRAGA